jgi:hypothetical protein
MVPPLAASAPSRTAIPPAPYRTHPGHRIGVPCPRQLQVMSTGFVAARWASGQPVSSGDERSGQWSAYDEAAWRHGETGRHDLEGNAGAAIAVIGASRHARRAPSRAIICPMTSSL